LCCREGLDKPPKPSKPPKRKDPTLKNGNDSTSSMGSKVASKSETRTNNSLNLSNIVATLKAAKPHFKTPTLEQALRNGKIDVIDLVNSDPPNSLTKLRRLHAKNTLVTGVQPLTKKEPRCSYSGEIPSWEKPYSFTPVNSNKGIDADIAYNFPPCNNLQSSKDKDLKSSVEKNELAKQKKNMAKRGWLEAEEILTSDDESTLSQEKGKSKGDSICNS
jgi:hypothetical protein